MLDTYVLDRLAPAAPTITTPPASPGNDPTPSWGIQLAPDAVTASCSVDGGPYTSCGTSFTADLSAAADGVHTIAVRNADQAGNQSTSTVGSYDLDRLAPGAPTITSPPSPSNVTTPVWSIASDAGTNTECRLDAGPWLPCTGSFTTTFASGSDGVHVLTVRATDGAGNRGPEATASYTLDTTAPNAPLIATAPADPSNSPTPIWTFTVDADSTATCSLDGGPWVACTSPHQVDLTSSPDGIHQLAVRATDAQSNVGPSTVSAFTLDRGAPEAPSITSAPSSPGSSATVSWSFTTPDGHHHPLPSRHRSGLQLRRLGDEDVHRGRPAPVHGGGHRPRRQPQRHHDGDVHARSGRPRAADDRPLAHDPGPGHDTPVDVRHRT